jgi:hypothetical protein
MNACRLTGRRMEDLKVLMVGAPERPGWRWPRS